MLLPNDAPLTLANTTLPTTEMLEIMYLTSPLYLVHGAEKGAARLRTTVILVDSVVDEDQTVFDS